LDRNISWRLRSVEGWDTCICRVTVVKSTRKCGRPVWSRLLSLATCHVSRPSTIRSDMLRHGSQEHMETGAPHSAPPSASLESSPSRRADRSGCL
jgi:hypothetical protein